MADHQHPSAPTVGGFEAGDGVSRFDYAIITPARDEEGQLPSLAKSVLEQKVYPSRWVIVDCGSSDRTGHIAKELAGSHPWIEHLYIPGPTRPTRGGPVVEAFEAGIATLSRLPSVIAKVDADVSIPCDYFDRLLCLFASHPDLGLAAGISLVPAGSVLRPQRVTGTMVHAAARAYRRECLQELLPLERHLGWEHIDQLQATNRGWRSIEVEDLFFRHLRPEGARDGDHYWVTLGATSHYLGYRPTYLLFRALYRARRDRKALGLIAGYAQAALAHAPKYSDREVRMKVREQQRISRLPHRVRELTGHAPTRRI